MLNATELSKNNYIQFYADFYEFMNEPENKNAIKIQLFKYISDI